MLIFYQSQSLTYTVANKFHLDSQGAVAPNFNWADELKFDYSDSLSRPWCRPDVKSIQEKEKRMFVLYTMN